MDTPPQPINRTDAGGHIVLAEADGAAYRSLRQRPVTRGRALRAGKALRKKVPRGSLAQWSPSSEPPGPRGEQRQRL